MFSMGTFPRNRLITVIQKFFYQKFFSQKFRLHNHVNTFKHWELGDRMAAVIVNSIIVFNSLKCTIYKYANIIWIKWLGHFTLRYLKCSPNLHLYFHHLLKHIKNVDQVNWLLFTNLFEHYRPLNGAFNYWPWG